MDERIRLITHEGKKILLIDFSRATSTQMMALLDEVERLVGLSPKASMLTLADFADVKINKAVATRIKEVLVRDRPHVKRSAWVHTKSLPKVLYENFKSFSKREFPTFDSRQEAMDWLVED